jgi:hypothetical protein
MRGLMIAGAAAAVLFFAAHAQGQMQPGGSVPYQSNNHPQYRTTTPVVGSAQPATGAIHAQSFGCVPSPMGTQAVRNPGSAGPALTGNINNCSHAAPAGTGVTGPH